MSGPDPAGKSHQYEQRYPSGNASYGPPHYATAGSRRQDAAEISANLSASGGRFVGGKQHSMTNHVGGGESSSSDLPPGYESPGPKASAYYNLSKGAMMENGPPGPTQRTASGRALPTLPGGAESMPTPRNFSGSRPLPPRPPMMSQSKSNGGGTEGTGSIEPYSDAAEHHKPRKLLPVTPGVSNHHHHDQLPSWQVDPRNQYAHGYPTSPPPDTAFQNTFPPAFAAVPRPSPGTPGAPAFPPTSPFPSSAMSVFPPSYMYGMPPMSAMDPSMYHTMPPPLASAGMMGYPSYGVFPPGYMPPSWPPAKPPTLPEQDHQPHTPAYFPNQQVPRVPSYSETHTSRRPPPIAVPEWPVSGLDSNGNAGVGVQEASALTPKPMLQNGSANEETWKESHRQNQEVPSNAAGYQDDSFNSMHLAAQTNDGVDQVSPHGGYQTSKPHSSMGNNSTTRKARGMEYLQSLGVTESTPTPDTLSEEASVIEIWPPDSYDQLISDSSTDHNATSERMQSATSLLHNTHIATQGGADSIFNHTQSQAHRESTVSIPNTIQSVGEGPSHPYERLARVSSVAPSWISQAREGGRPPARWVQNKLFLHQSHAESREGGGFDPESAADHYWDDDVDEDGMYRDEADASEEEENEMNFFMPSLESHVAVQLRDRVERNTHIKGGIAWPASFTGRDVVTVIQSLMPDWTRTSSNDRRFALSVARSLHKQLFFVEVDWDDKPLRDAMEGVYQFNEIDGAGALAYELPTGVQIMVTKCYSPSCVADKGCYSSRCPYNISPDVYLKMERKASMATINTVNMQEQERERIQNSLDESLLSTLSESERKRQLIIHQAVIAEEQYKADLEALETLYISPLRLADPPVIRSLKDLEELINGIFGNIIELREANARILEFFLIRKREEGGLLMTVGDIFLSAAADFRNLYPEYIGGLPKAEERLKIELNQNANFRAFVETVRQNARRDFDHRRMDLKHLMTRPSTQLNRYPPILEAILAETPADSPDALFLSEAIKAIRNLTFAAQLKLWQGTTGRTEHVPNADPLLKKEAKDQSGDKNWHEFVSKEDLEVMTEKERKLQE
ncbi:hypothetical protein QFC22_002278 [Naganishia vaughanmartiniae]|uniref:Uncharacterized protein n=1 Tax=Naganishia vaughanmartiniae TaxID=1424756 RepID=A0ACC2XC85_9TREE|nr:hypothetical protein QFC22_002278 [Naganishia vaughanmartiniae]